MARRRPRALDAVLVGVVVLLVAGVAAAQFHLGSGGGTATAPSASATPSYLQTSVGNPYPEPSDSPAPSASVPPSAASSAAQSSAAAQSSLAAQAQSLAAQQPATFRVGTLNTLGSSHTSRRGDEAARPSGVERMAHTVALLARHDVAVVGLQEFETVQAQAFHRATGSSWQIYPDLPGDTRDAVAWRTDTFELVQGQTMQIPYFNGALTDMPVVLLREKRTGKQIYFFNVHNSADTYKYHHQQGNRTSAMAKEVAIIKQMRAYKLPVIFTGDLNEREPAFCYFTSQLPLHSAYGGTNDAAGCRPPDIGGVPIDWIFGSLEVTFSDPVKDTSPLDRVATDHPFYSATVTLN
jgi:endonuclease/exonuclease/phosphatase family metal-dependent hydrolase